MHGGTLYGGGRGLGALRVAAAGAVLVPGFLDQPGDGGVADRALEGEDRLWGQDTADTGSGGDRAAARPVTTSARLCPRRGRRRRCVLGVHGNPPEGRGTGTFLPV